MVEAAAFSTRINKRLSALVQCQRGSDDSFMGAPAAAVYNSKPAGIVDVFVNLREKAESELTDSRKATGRGPHNFDLLAQCLNDLQSAEGEVMLLVVTAPQCYTGSGGALGPKEDVGVKIDDLGANGAGHMEVAGSGIAASYAQTKPSRRVASKSQQISAIASMMGSKVQ